MKYLPQHNVDLGLTCPEFRALSTLGLSTLECPLGQTEAAVRVTTVHRDWLYQQILTDGASEPLCYCSTSATRVHYHTFLYLPEGCMARVVCGLPPNYSNFDLLEKKNNVYTQPFLSLGYISASWT